MHVSTINNMLLLFLQLLLLICPTTRASIRLYPDEDEVLKFCEDDAFVIRCVTDTGVLVWSLGSSIKIFSHVLPSSTHAALGDSVTVVLVSSSAEESDSVATVLRAQSNLNGSVLICKDSGQEGTPVKRKIFLIAGEPSKPTNVNFTPVDLTSATIHWMLPVENSNCIEHFVVYIETEDMLYNSTTTTNTSLKISSLEKGEEHMVKIAAVDRMGRVGENTSILMNLTVPQCIRDLIVQTCDESTLFVSWKEPPSSSRPSVMHYAVQHNVTDNDNLIQVNTKETSISITGARLGRVYSIEVTAVNVLGPGPSVNVSVSVMHTVTTVSNLSTTTTVIEQMQTTCSCAVELGVSMSICFLLMVGGCFLTAIIIIKKHILVQITTILWRRCKEKFSTFGSSEDPNMMNPNIAYEEQEPGYTETFHKYHNTNPTLVRVDCHVYDQPAKITKDKQ